jgi:integrator complex subunit 4
MQISDCMQFDESEMLDGIKKLCDHFRKDQSVVRVKILSLLGDFATELNVDGNFLAEEILNLLKSDDSANAKVLCSAFSVLHKIGASQSLPPATLNKLVEFAKSKLTSHRYNVQRHAILLIGAFASIQEAEAELLDLVSRYTDSQDARVRAQAFGTILKMGERGVKLDPTLYPRAEKALKDDYECVRREALQLIYEIGTKHAEHLIPIPDSEQELRLIDDAFGKVCSAISDISMQIRQLAAGLLGGMSNVNTEFLHQTLDKKLMSNMRRKKSLHERALENFTSGEWSSGKKWADDAPKELLHSDTISLIDSGSCGALVQGLEDEFLEVRLSSVRSICRLSLINPPFACYSLDFLIDMFNDEIESVRLETIHSLTRISNHIMLREDQLEIMLSSLEDYSVEVREGLHLMLGACKVSTKACLILVIQKVLDVLSKYPTDKLSAYGCLQRVGQKHPELCMSLTTQLLQDHPFFDSAERDVEDPTCKFNYLESQTFFKYL